MAISVAPSQKWEGNGGPWSSFALQIGTPPQTIRVLPASSGSSIWAVLPEGCAADTDPADCDELRALLFDPDESSTFDREGNGYFELPFEAEAALGYSGNSMVGYDNLTLGWPGSGGPTLDQQVITGFATKAVMLGQLGLTPRPVNVTDFADPYDSPLTALRNGGIVSSLYWAYTAGARYREPEVFGSLTLGGYDAARGNPDDGLTVPLGADTSRDLMLQVDRIAIDDGAEGEPLTTFFQAYVNSVIPELWLPGDICRAFERAFGLQWNADISRYLVNDTQHSRLVRDNFTVLFTLSAPGGENSVNITLPYAAFDMQASYPLAGLASNETARYFPLMRAENSTQLVLGRAFLQEVYLAVDYDRSQFYLTQALVPDQRAALELRTVSPPGNNDVLRPGPIAGVAIGSVVFLALLGVSFWWCLRRRRRSAGTGAREAGKSATDLSKEDQDQDQRAFKPELDATNTAVGRGMERQELETPTDLAKLPKSSSVGAVELGDAQVHEAEAPLTRAAGWKPGVSELDDAAVHELGGSHAYRELPARQDARQYQAELP